MVAAVVYTRVGFCHLQACALKFHTGTIAGPSGQQVLVPPLDDTCLCQDNLEATLATSQEPTAVIHVQPSWSR